MKPLSWKSYYDKFYDWEESTQKNYSNRLSGFGPAEEVWEIAQEFAFSDEKFASNFLQRALDAGVRFTPEQVLEMAVNIEKHILSRAAELSSIGAFGQFCSEGVSRFRFLGYGAKPVAYGLRYGRH